MIRSMHSAPLETDAYENEINWNLLQVARLKLTSFRSSLLVYCVGALVAILTFLFEAISILPCWPKPQRVVVCHCETNCKCQSSTM